MPRARRISDSHPELGLPEVRKLWQTEGLFSDHYLKKRIKENSWWPTDAEAQPFLNFARHFTRSAILRVPKITKHSRGRNCSTKFWKSLVSLSQTIWVCQKACKTWSLTTFFIQMKR